MASGGNLRNGKQRGGHQQVAPAKPAGGKRKRSAPAKGQESPQRSHPSMSDKTQPGPDTPSGPNHQEAAEDNGYEQTPLEAKPLDPVLLEV